MQKISMDMNELTIKMGWSFISVQDQKNKLIIPIEQKVEKKDVVVLPSTGSFASMPMSILREKLAELNWNREIEFVERPVELSVIPISEKEYEEGSLESTAGGQEFLSLDLFDPDNEIEKAVVKELWLNLEKRFAEAATGFVSIYVHSVDEDSVFSKITIPTLMSNGNVTLNFIENE